MPTLRVRGTGFQDQKMAHNFGRATGLMVDGEMIASDTISALNSGQDRTLELSWIAYEGEHDLEVVVLSGVSPLTTEQYDTKVVVKENKGIVEPTSFLDQWMIPILVIVAVVVIVSLVAVGLRGSKKEEEELRRQEIDVVRRAI